MERMVVMGFIYILNKKSDQVYMRNRMKNMITGFLLISLAFTLTSCNVNGTLESSGQSIRPCGSNNEGQFDEQFIKISKESVFDVKSVALGIFDIDLSADDTWLAFSGKDVEYKNDNSQLVNIWVKDVRKNSEWKKLLTNENAIDEGAVLSFSPNGKYIAAITRNRILLFDTDHWQEFGDYKKELYTTHFSWLPDSSGIVIQIDQNGIIAEVLKLDGSFTSLIQYEYVFPRQLPSYEIRSLFDFGPTWSPDGTEIAFLQFITDYSPSKLWVMNINSGEKKMLAEGQYSSAEWSPDGKKIALEGNGVDIQIFDLQELELCSLFSKYSSVTKYSIYQLYNWSPDGKKIALGLDFPDKKDSGIYIIDVNTGVMTLLINGHDHQFQWTKNNTILLEDLDNPFSIQIVHLE
jgi:Tol biopolymer transport system component